MVDPTQERDDNQHNHGNCHNKENDATAVAVGAGAQRDDPDKTEEEGADEGREHVLRRAVLHDQRGGTGRYPAACGAVSGHHRAQRECGDSQHA